MRKETLASLRFNMIRPMTTDESKTFIALMMAPDVITSAQGLEDSFGEEGMGMFLLAVMVKRLGITDQELQYSRNAVLMAASLCTNPAMSVMWAYTISEDTRAGHIFNMSRFADIFPMGVPTDDGYHKLWAEQKLTREERVGLNDNWLDTNEAWA